MLAEFDYLNRLPLSEGQRAAVIQQGHKTAYELYVAVTINPLAFGELLYPLDVKSVRKALVAMMSWSDLADGAAHCLRSSRRCEDAPSDQQSHGCG